MDFRRNGRGRGECKAVKAAGLGFRPSLPRILNLDTDGRCSAALETGMRRFESSLKSRLRWNLSSFLHAWRLNTTEFNVEEKSHIYHLNAMRELQETERGVALEEAMEAHESSIKDAEAQQRKHVEDLQQQHKATLSQTRRHLNSTLILNLI